MVDVDVGSYAWLAGAARDVQWMAVETEIRRLRALQSALTLETLRSGSYADDGHRNPTGWVAAVANCSNATAARHVRHARLLADMPVLAAACAAGEIGDDQLAAIAGLHTNPRCRALLPDSDALLTGYARTLTYREFTQVCARWLAHADPDGWHRDHETARHNRRVSIRRHGAGFEMTVTGDALTGDVIEEILQRHTNRELAADIRDRTLAHGPDSGTPLARTTAQRRYDALYTIALRADRTTGGRDRDPLVIIHCTPDVLSDAVRGLFAQPALGQTSSRMRLCETASGAPVDPHDLAVAALIGRIQRIITDPNGNATNLGRRQRLFTGSARDAVLLTGDRCCWPGCNQRSTGIQIDHRSPWAYHHGATNTLNGAPLCPHHNRHKHADRTTITRDPHGWHHQRPNGTTIAPRTPEPP